MTMRHVALLALGILALGCGRLQHTPTIAELDLPSDLPEFNRLVLEVCSEYPTDGTFGYWWPRGDEPDFVSYDGCTRDMIFQGKVVMTGEPRQRSFCCGFTLEVFLEAYNRWLAEHGPENAQLTPADWRRFQRQWFVIEVNGPGPNAALEMFDLGRTVERDDWDSALPGDLCNYWNTETDSGHIGGHSVVFLGWDRDRRGEIRGLHFISTQGSTNGIGYMTVPFGADGGLSRRFTFIGRAEPQVSQ